MQKKTKMTKYNFNLKTNEYLSNCDSKDVIALGSQELSYIHQFCDLVRSSLDYKVTNHIISLINQKLGNRRNAELWLEKGEKCEILKAGSSGWQTGKIKLKLEVNLTLEFIPDEPEAEPSPLDDVRQELERGNS